MYQTWDFGSGSIDRYTVFPFRRSRDPAARRMFLGMSDSPSHPLGVSMWGELPRGTPNPAHLGRRIPFRSLPSNVQAHVIARLKDGK